MNTLFAGKMEYNSDSELKIYLSELDFTNAVEVLEVGLEHAVAQGAFSLREAAVLTACLMKIRNAPQPDSDTV
jgi:hypothetical protein